MDAQRRAAFDEERRRRAPTRDAPGKKGNNRHSGFKSSICAKVEHPFRVLKRQIEFTRLRYRGLKNRSDGESVRARSRSELVVPHHGGIRRQRGSIVQVINSSAQSSSVAVSEVWGPFAMSVAGVVARLKEDQFVIISAKRSNRFIQFAGQGSYGLRAEVVANAFLHPDERIDEAGLEDLRNLGWCAPTGSPEAATPELAPDGSPNYFMQCPTPVDSTKLADVAVQTLRQVLGVSHPGFLEYESFDADGKRLSFPSLGLRKARKKAKPPSTVDPAAAVLSALRQITGLVDLEFDEDGDLAVCYGSIVAITSLAPDGSHARIRAPLVVGVGSSLELLARINDINMSTRYLRLVFGGTAIIGVTEVPLVPFVQEHFAALFVEVCRVGDALFDVLSAEFAGCDHLGSSSISTAKH